MESNGYIKLFKKYFEIACHIIERPFGQSLEFVCNCELRVNKKAGASTLILPRNTVFYYIKRMM